MTKFRAQAFDRSFICLDARGAAGASLIKISYRVLALGTMGARGQVGEIAVKCGGRSGLVNGLLLACAMLLPSACASTSTSYMGIPFTTGAADAELQFLARRAYAGDKHAQLELGIRFEEGRGLPTDLKRAENLYRLAASDGGGRALLFIPSVGQSGEVAAVPVSSGPPVGGLAEARRRLARLDRGRR